MLQSASADDRLVAIKGSKSKRKKKAGQICWSFLNQVHSPGFPTLWNRLHFYCVNFFFLFKGSQSPIIASHYNDELFKWNNKTFSTCSLAVLIQLWWNITENSYLKTQMQKDHNTNIKLRWLELDVGFRTRERKLICMNIILDKTMNFCCFTWRTDVINFLKGILWRC